MNTHKVHSPELSKALSLEDTAEGWTVVTMLGLGFFGLEGERVGVFFLIDFDLFLL